MNAGKSRVVPVSELFNRLAAEYRASTIPNTVLFQAALRVCAEDSKRTRRGEPPAQIAALVEQARAILDVSHPGSSPRSPADWPSAPTGVRISASKTPLAQNSPTPTTGAGAARVPPAPAAPPPPLPPPAAPLGSESSVSPVAAPFEVHAEPASPVPTPSEPELSFEDVFRQATDAEPEDVPSEGRNLSRLLFRVGIPALTLLAAAVVIVILWPAMAPRPSAPPSGVEPSAAAPSLASQAPLATAPVAPTPVPAAPPTATPAPEPTQSPAEPTAMPARPEVVQGVETMRSPDWAGHPPAFVVHFASYRSRGNATADAARLARDLGRPAYAILVDLGEKGTWYRVVVGDFATVDEARAFRAEIAAAKTREVGGVYRLAAP